MQNNKKKITLNSQTIRNLRPEKLGEVVGGIPTTSGTPSVCGNCRACG